MDYYLKSCSSAGQEIYVNSLNTNLQQIPDEVHSKMTLFKLTLNQPEINANDIILITHHNKIIVCAGDEEYATQLADEVVEDYADARVTQKTENNDKPISPWLKSNLVICRIYKGPKYQGHDEEDVVYPPDLVSEHDGT